jgi:hypothetical protein
MHLYPIPRLGGELTTSLQIRPRAMFFFFFSGVDDSDDDDIDSDASTTRQDQH